MKSLSNLIKSSFVAFSKEDAMIIDANKNKIIQSLDVPAAEMAVSDEESVEEALAEALIRDAELDGVDFGDDVLTFDTSELPDLSGATSDLTQVADEVVRSAKQEAEEIINKAHDEAEIMRATAFEEAKSIRNDAHDEGYKEGYQEGIDKARQEILEEKNALLTEKQEFQEQMNEWKEALLNETKNQMVDLLCLYIPTVTGVVIENQRNVLLYMVNCALQEQDNSTNYVIKVSPMDYSELLTYKDEIYGISNPNISIELFEDSKLSKYQCLIETDNGIIDVSLDVQLDNLLTALKLLIKD